MSNAIITREYKGSVFTFREDGYFNMKDAAKKFGKEVKHFWGLPSTVEYLEALRETVGKSDLYETRVGRNGGTWGHPKLAVFFARWLDVKFAVFCDMVIDDILNKKAELTITKMAMKVPQSFPERPAQGDWRRRSTPTSPLLGGSWGQTPASSNSRKSES